MKLSDVLRQVACHSCRRTWGLLPIIVEKGGLVLFICSPCGYQNNLSEAQAAFKEEVAKHGAQVA